LGLCDEFGIKPNHIYNWQKILFDNAATAFHQVANRNASNRSAQEEKIARLEAKLVQKNEVISEVAEKTSGQNNSLGNSERTLGSP
jgi:hypothetical protein